MRNINRGALRITETARAQHETAVAHSISKILLREELDPSSIVTMDSSVRPLGVFLVTGVYVDGKIHSYVKTWAELNNVDDIKTEWVQSQNYPGLFEICD